MKPTLCIARDCDTREWQKLRCELWPTCSMERHGLEVAQLLAGPGLVVLADIGGEVVGFAELSVRTDHVEGTTISPIPYLEGWYVSERFRGEGVGRALLAFAEEWAVAKGYGELASDSEIDNKAGIDLHKSVGFQEVGKTVHFVKSLLRNNAQ